MTELEFQSLARDGYNRIPLIGEHFADLDTPLSLYLKLAHVERAGAHSFLLESVVGGERFGRYSFIGLPARTLIRARGYGDDAVTEVVTDGQVVETMGGNPLDNVAAYKDRFRVAVRPGLPRFAGGLAGYFGYDVARYIEPRLVKGAKVVDDDEAFDLPDILLLLTEEVVVVDNLAGKIYVIVYADPTKPEAYGRAKSRLRELRDRLRRPVDVPYSQPSMRTDAHRGFAKTDYLAAVAVAKEMIAAGEVMQVQIGQRIVKPFRDAPLTLYRALRSLNPSPYLYFYNFGDFHVVGSSPEILVRHELRPKTDGAEGNDTIVTIRPLAGTRPRGATPAQDAALAKELLSDPKEIAEHVMLIDLARNDVGRIAQIGSVKVTEKLAVEKYSHVMHIVSSVEGTLKPGLTSIDVLKATFPAGTLSGAPKVRAMEIIDQLEPTKRGLYGGACGYLSFSGEMDLAIAIRTGVVKNGLLAVQAAAGIVADSVPEMEWQETENKARAVLRAAEQVQDGLDAG
ncbi:MAG: chorismate-binding protein [Burkholderiaceae bacterium]